MDQEHAFDLIEKFLDTNYHFKTGDEACRAIAEMLHADSPTLSWVDAYNFGVAYIKMHAVVIDLSKEGHA